MGQGKLGEVILRGTRAAQPLATDVSDGTIYFVTDELVTERSNHTVWQSITDGGSTGITSLTGDVTGTGPGATATTIANNAVSNAKLRDSGALSVIGRSANSSGDPADISAVAASGSVLRESGSVLGFGTVAAAGLAADSVITTKILDANVTSAKLRDSALLSVIGRSANSAGVPGDIAAVAASGSVLRESGSTIGFGTIVAAGIASDAVTTAKILDANVTLAKIVNVSAASRLLGRGSAAGAGVPQEITLGTGLSMSGTALSASAGSAGRQIINFNQPVGGAGLNPADSTQYFFLTAAIANPGTSTNGPFGPMVTRDGTATRVYIKVVIGGTLASAQNVTFTLHNNTAGTSEVITAVAQLTASPTVISNTAMTLAYTAGDVMQVSMTGPVWATNPTGCFFSFTVEFTPT